MASETEQAVLSYPVETPEDRFSHIKAHMKFVIHQAREPIISLLHVHGVL